MKFTQEEIKGGIIITFRNQNAIAFNADEAETAIERFISRYSIPLKVNAQADYFLHKLFTSQEIQQAEFKTTNCSVDSIRFYKALAPSLDEHQKLYTIKCLEEKNKRLEEEKKRNETMLAEFKLKREGWYYVSVELTALTFEGKRKYRTHSGYGIAESMTDAYNKFYSVAERDITDSGLILEHISTWNSSETIIKFLGMKTDEGYSIEAWDKAKKEGKI